MQSMGGVWGAVVDHIPSEQSAFSELTLAASPVHVAMIVESKPGPSLMTQQP
jgi:hypothetical protein